MCMSMSAAEVRQPYTTTSATLPPLAGDRGYTQSLGRMCANELLALLAERGPRSVFAS